MQVRCGHVHHSNLIFGGTALDLQSYSQHVKLAINALNALIKGEHTRANLTP